MITDDLVSYWYVYPILCKKNINFVEVLSIVIFIGPNYFCFYTLRQSYTPRNSTIYFYVYKVLSI